MLSEQNLAKSAHMTKIFCFKKNYKKVRRILRIKNAPIEFFGLIFANLDLLFFYSTFQGLYIFKNVLAVPRENA